MNKLIKAGALLGVFVLLGAGAFAFTPRARAQTVSVPATTASDPVVNVIPSSGVFNTGGSLGNLALLDALFNNGSTGILSNSGRLDLGDFVLLHEAFNNSDITQSNFPDLFALGRIFSGTGVLNDNGTSLGDVLILDQLFNR